MVDFRWAFAMTPTSQPRLFERDEAEMGEYIVSSWLPRHPRSFRMRVAARSRSVSLYHLEGFEGWLCQVATVRVPIGMLQIGVKEKVCGSVGVRECRSEGVRE